MSYLEQSLPFEEDGVNGGADQVGLADGQQSDEKPGEKSLR